MAEGNLSHKVTCIEMCSRSLGMRPCRHSRSYGYDTLSWIVTPSEEGIGQDGKRNLTITTAILESNVQPRSHRMIE